MPNPTTKQYFIWVGILLGTVLGGILVGQFFLLF